MYVLYSTVYQNLKNFSATYFFQEYSLKSDFIKDRIYGSRFCIKIRDFAFAPIVATQHSWCMAKKVSDDVVPQRKCELNSRHIRTKTFNMTNHITFELVGCGEGLQIGRSTFIHISTLCHFSKRILTFYLFCPFSPFVATFHGLSKNCAVAQTASLLLA